jgi:hypothetical protein
MNVHGNRPLNLCRSQLPAECAGQVRLEQASSTYPSAAALSSVFSRRGAVFGAPSDPPGSWHGGFLIRFAGELTQLAGSFQFSMDDLLHAVFIQPSIQRQTPVYHDQWGDNRSALDKIERLAAFFIVVDHQINISQSH